VRTVRLYFAALNARRAAVVCALLVPGAIDELRPPRRRDGCARSLGASLGYADPRGFPVWRLSRLERIRSVTREPAGVRVTVSVVHGFAHRDPVPAEEDVIHLVRRGRRWLIVKPSATLYRAVGKADVPPSVLAAP
jgi:hypothetical protein